MDSKLHTFGDFWRPQFDKLLLLSVLFVLISLMVMFLKWGDKDGFQWAQRAYDNIQGALLMLLTGRALLRSGDSSDTTNRTTITDQGVSVTNKTEGGS